MADFLNNLWSSVFTPGPTPTLLVATNVSFGALQLLLAALLIATYSIHFAILSVLCGGLRWSINWFAMELKAAQVRENEAEKTRRRKGNENEWRRRGEVADSADDEGEDTEVEESKTGMRESTSSLAQDAEDDQSRIRREIRDAMGSSGNEGQSSAVTTSAQQAEGGAEVRQRTAEDMDRSGEMSTDSEWEKISHDGDR